MENFGSFKEFYDVILRANSAFNIGSRHFDEGEVLARFDRINLAGLQEVSRLIAAKGGYHNRSHVFWNDVNEVNISFTQGVFSKTQLALLMNSKVLTEQQELVFIHQHEELEVIDKMITLKYTPKPSSLFIYSKDNGNKFEYTINENEVTIDIDDYTDVICEYDYQYDNHTIIFNIGERLLNGFVSLEGKTHVKDDNTGSVVTGIIKIPRIRITSGLSIRLGNSANPYAGSFNGVATPVGARGNNTIVEFFFLDDDIDSDI